MHFNDAISHLPARLWEDYGARDSQPLYAAELCNGCTSAPGSRRRGQVWQQGDESGSQGQLSHGRSWRDEGKYSTQTLDELGKFSCLQASLQAALRLQVLLTFCCRPLCFPAYCYNVHM